MFLYDNPPCKNCSNRYPTCHAECKMYANWNSEHTKKRKEIVDRFSIGNQIVGSQIDKVYKARKRNHKY